MLCYNYNKGVMCLLDKFVRVFYNILSVIVHISLITLIFSVPVLFAVKANSPLEFKVNDIKVSKASVSDEHFPEVSASAEGWYKIDYDISVKASKLSPYGYQIDKISLKDPSEMRYGGNCETFLDEPVAFITGGSDDAVLTCYIRYDGDEASAAEYAKTFSFGAVHTTRVFSFFKYKIPVNVPGFDVSECLA